MSIKKPSLESLKVADEIINYVTKGKNTLTIDQLKSSKIFPKAEMIYYTIKMISESDLQSFIDNYNTRPIDFNIDKYERNIVFLGCSLTYGEGVKNQDTYPSKVQQLSNNKWNCINLGICGRSVDLAYILFNKVNN